MDAASRRGFGSPVPWLAAAALFSVTLFHPAVFNDGDTFWHLATGEWILVHGHVPDADPFSFTKPGTAWVCHEWLAEVLLALAYRAGGWSAMAVLAAIAAAAALLQFTAYVSRWIPPLAAAVLAFAAVALTAPSLLIRPHLLVLPLLVGWTIAHLDARSAGRTPSWWLIPIMALWANMHGSYLVGVAVTGVFALEAIIAKPERRVVTLRAWGLFLGAALLSSLTTPHGLTSALHPVYLMRMDTLPMLIEWRPLDLSRFQPLVAIILAGIYFLASRGIRLPPIRLLLLLATIYLALTHARHGILVCFVGMIAVVEAWAGQAGSRPPAPSSRLWPAIGAVALLVLTLVRFTWPADPTDGPSMPTTALSRVPSDVKSRPVLNDYAFGGYLILAGVRPYIDGRADMYGDAFIGDYVAATGFDRATLEAALARHGVQWTILKPDSSATALMDEISGWCQLYSDSVAVVHARQSLGRCRAQ